MHGLDAITANGAIAQAPFQSRLDVGPANEPHPPAVVPVGQHGRFGAAASPSYRHYHRPFAGLVQTSDLALRLCSLFVLIANNGHRVCGALVLWLGHVTCVIANVAPGPAGQIMRAWAV